jgi:hypothetical protein
MALVRVFGPDGEEYKGMDEEAQRTVFGSIARGFLSSLMAQATGEGQTIYGGNRNSSPLIAMMAALMGFNKSSEWEEEVPAKSQVSTNLVSEDEDEEEDEEEED